MRKKFIHLLIFFLFLQNCGYSPIYSVQNKTNFKFNIVEINGSNKMNNIFNIQINRFSNDTSNNKRDLKGFWLTAEHCDPSPSKNSDSFVVKEGYVSITPLHSEQTNLKFIKELSAWSFNWFYEE